MRINSKFSSGFTLIETLLYIGLLGIILGGFIETAYQIIESSNRIREKVYILEETNFMLRKMSFLLNGAVSIAKPDAGDSGPILKIEAGGSHITVSFDSAIKQVSIKRDISPVNVLNSDFFLIENLLFEHVVKNGKDMIKATLTIQGEEYKLIKALQ